jgi:hypothetical protein
MEDLSKEKIWRTLQSFQKDRNLGLDGFTIEFFTSCFEFLGDGLLNLVEYSRTSEQTVAPFNSPFISLIPKVENPQNFD